MRKVGRRRPPPRLLSYRFAVKRNDPFHSLFLFEPNSEALDGGTTMAEATALWELLRQTADPSVTDALKSAVETGSDRSLNRVNPLAFAERGLNEEAVIGALVHAARLGLFDMFWNMLCPGCGGVLEAAAALKALNRDHYFCAFCVQDNEPTLDQLVEVTFTVNPRIRRIGAHDPSTLSHAEYMRQIFWSSGAVVSEDIEAAIQRVTLDL